MAVRTVKDAAGREWTCESAAVTGDAAQGQDVVVSCSTASVAEPVRLTVGWQWESMAAPGFARLITTQSPVPKR
jgi:hypothetical protein